MRSPLRVVTHVAIFSWLYFVIDAFVQFMCPHRNRSLLKHATITVRCHADRRNGDASIRRSYQIPPAERIGGNPGRNLDECRVTVGAAEKLQAERQSLVFQQRQRQRRTAEQ